jgi:hypothetical protein
MYNDGQYESYQNFASHPTLPWQLEKTKKEYESVQLHGAIYSLSMRTGQKINQLFPSCQYPPASPSSFGEGDQGGVKRMLFTTMVPFMIYLFFCEIMMNCCIRKLSDRGCTQWWII